jgi:hypothetical protein
MAKKAEKAQLTEHQAYRAMLKFLESQYDRARSDDLGSLLGSAELLNDGDSADPAILAEWKECVAAVLAGDSGREAAE